MATRKATDTKAAEVVVGGDMVVAGSTGLAVRPDFIEEGQEGTDDIGAEEIKLPRLAVAQLPSPQLDPDSSVYIEGLKFGDMFNDLTGEVFGRGPVGFIPVKRTVKHIEFAPDGKGVVDLDVSPEDARTRWTTDPESGNRVPPKATKFVEFIGILLADGSPRQPVVLSIQQTNKYAVKATDRLTTFIKLRNSHIYAGMYAVATKSEKNDSGTFGVFVIDNAGFVQDRELYTFAKAFHDSLAHKTIVVNRTAEPEPAAAEGSGPAM